MSIVGQIMFYWYEGHKRATTDGSILPAPLCHSLANLNMPVKSRPHTGTQSLYWMSRLVFKFYSSSNSTHQMEVMFILRCLSTSSIIFHWHSRANWSIWISELRVEEASNIYNLWCTVWIIKQNNGTGGFKILGQENVRLILEPW